MEAVGARLGRSSTRYGGPSTVFSGPVRRWKKKWVHVTSSSSPASNSGSVRDHQIRSSEAGNGINGNNGSHVMLYKWTPMAQREGSVAAAGETTPGREEEEGVEEPPKRKMKYIPIALLEEQRNEALEQAEEEIKAIEVEPSTEEPATITNVADEKPDINDTPVKENEDEDGGKEELQDLNKSTLDLSLGLTSHDEKNNSLSKPDEENE